MFNMYNTGCQLRNLQPINFIEPSNPLEHETSIILFYSGNLITLEMWLVSSIVSQVLDMRKRIIPILRLCSSTLTKINLSLLINLNL